MYLERELTTVSGDGNGLLLIVSDCQRANACIALRVGVDRLQILGSKDLDEATITADDSVLTVSIQNQALERCTSKYTLSRLFVAFPYLNGFILENGLSG